MKNNDKITSTSHAASPPRDDSGSSSPTESTALWPSNATNTTTFGSLTVRPSLPSSSGIEMTPVRRLSSLTGGISQTLSPEMQRSDGDLESQSETSRSLDSNDTAHPQSMASGISTRTAVLGSVTILAVGITIGCVAADSGRKAAEVLSYYKGYHDGIKGLPPKAPRG